MEKQNIIYIHTHDSGKIFSPYGYKVPTPAIEEFAGDAVVFRNAFSAAPTCSPSRASLLTGMYPHTAGMLGLCNRGFRLDDYRDHLVSVLKEHQYHTALCGIQHEAAHFADPGAGAAMIGYDENITTDENLKALDDKRKWDQQNCDNAAAWLGSRKRDQPFFLSFGMFCTHRPHPVPEEGDADFIRPPDGYPDREEIRRDFAGHCRALAHVDACVGRILDTLKETGLYEKSIIIFTTDHGIAFPFAKSFLSDAGISVGLIMRVPGKDTGIIEYLVSQVDILPTLCDLIGLPARATFQGQSFAAYFNREERSRPLRREIFAEMNFHTSYEPARCIRTDRYKYIEYLDIVYDGQNLSNVNESPTKTCYLNHGLKERKKPMRALYDLLYDPSEKNNLIDSEEYRKTARSLQASLKEWQRQTGDPLLYGEIKWQDSWIVNKKTSLTPHGSGPDDFVGLH